MFEPEETEEDDDSFAESSYPRPSPPDEIQFSGAGGRRALVAARLFNLSWSVEFGFRLRGLPRLGDAVR